jgi:hypothetical protein
MLYNLTTPKKKRVNNDLKRLFFALTGKFHWHIFFSFVFLLERKKKEKQ